MQQQHEKRKMHVLCDGIHIKTNDAYKASSIDLLLRVPILSVSKSMFIALLFRYLSIVPVFPAVDLDL
jgi:hypothetical protein